MRAQRGRAEHSERYSEDGAPILCFEDIAEAIRAFCLFLQSVHYRRVMRQDFWISPSCAACIRHGGGSAGPCRRLQAVRTMLPQV